MKLLYFYCSLPNKKLCYVKAPNLKSGDPEFESRSDRQLDFFGLSLVQQFQGGTGEYSKVTGGLLLKDKPLSGNKQNLTREFWAAAGEFSDLQCLMNTLQFVQAINE